MFSLQTHSDWVFVFFPLAVVLSIAMWLDIRTGKIPNSLVCQTLLYFFIYRLCFGPEPFASYLGSFLLTSVVLIAFALQVGSIGFGAVKLTMAVSLVFQPSYAILLCLGIITTFLLGAAMSRWIPLRRFSGAVILSFWVAVAIVAKTLIGT